MWLLITLFNILFVLRTHCQDSFKVVQCSKKTVSITPDIRIKVLTPPPIMRMWEAEIFLGDRNGSLIETIGLQFNIDTVGVYIDPNKYPNLQRLPFAESKTIYDTPHVYDTRGTDVNAFLVSVSNYFNDIAPSITKLFINRFDECPRLIELQYKRPRPMRRSRVTANVSNTATQNKPEVYSNLNTTTLSPIISTTNSNSEVKTVQNIERVTEEAPEIRKSNARDTESCGRRLKKYKGYIANGYMTSRGDWPWHAALYHIGRSSVEYKCGGSLIKMNAILTAAHCIYERGQQLIRKRIIVKLGLYSKFGEDSHTQQIDVRKVIPHTNFSETSWKNDIAILQLESEVLLNDYVHPVCLWLKDKASIYESEGKEGYVIGWGKTENQEQADYLNEAKMPVVSHEDCLDRHSEFYNRFLSSKSFCAGFRNGTGVCNGDSGGGMFFQDNDGIFRIRGIVSLGRALDGDVCDTFEYVIFTDVGQYLDWIENTIS